MIDSNEYKDQENKESDTALVPSELHILVTDADTNGYEISKMSDFMGLYAQQLTRSFRLLKWFQIFLLQTLE